MALEGLHRPVLAQLAHVDAHVCAAGGKRVVALPVYVQSRGWRGGRGVNGHIRIIIIMTIIIILIISTTFVIIITIQKKTFSMSIY